jgi:hypothetical protein
MSVRCLVIGWWPELDDQMHHCPETDPSIGQAAASPRDVHGNDQRMELDHAHYI